MIGSGSVPCSKIQRNSRMKFFDQAGMASILPPDPPPVVPKRDKRTLPPEIRQEIINLHAEYPAFRPHELATMCFVKFGRKPSPQTIKLTLSTGPKPTRSRRFQRWAEIADSLFATWICTDCLGRR